MRSFLCFHAQQYSIPNSTYSLVICLEFSRATMSQGHWTLPLSFAIPFNNYYLWPGLTNSLHLFMSPFSTCGVRWVLFLSISQFFRSCVWNATSWKSFSTLLTAINKVFGCIFYIADNIVILFYQLLYVLLWVMSSFGSHQVLKKIFCSNYF